MFVLFQNNHEIDISTRKLFKINQTCIIFLIVKLSSVLIIPQISRSIIYFPSMLNTIDSNSSEKAQIITIHFTLQKQVDFGKGVFVVGNTKELGQWNVENSLQLQWKEGHQWCGCIKMRRNQREQIHFKYVISNYEKPSKQICIWEEGNHNRILSLANNRNTFFTSHRWNEDKITLYLFVPKCSHNCEYYIVGNIPQLGSWKATKQLQNINIDKQLLKKINQYKGDNIEKSQIQSLFMFSFYVLRNRQNIHYYYIRKNAEIIKQRQPGRTIDLANLQLKKHPQCFLIDFNFADIQIYQTCDFQRLRFSKITEQIYLGAHLRTKADFEKMQENSINCILSIQTKEDFRSHNLSTHYIKILSQQHNIDHHQISIKDMDVGDFISKCSGAFFLLRKLIQQQNKKVYVHCSAGMYRSPHLVIIYLMIMNKWQLKQAIDYVIQKHPFSRPNEEILIRSINQIHHNISKLSKQGNYLIN